MKWLSAYDVIVLLSESWKGTDRAQKRGPLCAICPFSGMEKSDIINKSNRFDDITIKEDQNDDLYIMVDDEANAVSRAGDIHPHKNLCI